MNFQIQIEEMVDLVQQENSEEFYTMKDLKTVMPLGQNQIYKLVHTKGFPKIMIGRRILIPKTQFNEWVNKNIGSKIAI